MMAPPQQASRVRIGQTEEGAPVELDVERLVHAFIAGSTGSGKSNTMRVILERARGPILPNGGVVHQAVIDPEGEFASTLPQLGDYIVFNAAGPLRIDAETAPSLAETFVELGFNLVADMSDVPRDEAHEWIAGFCRALATTKVERSPRAHGRRAVVVLDEVQKYAPELNKQVKGEEYPAAGPIIQLVDTGRKRWVHVIAASLRMAKVRADLRSECSTFLVGKLNRDDDREEAAKELGLRRAAVRNPVVEKIAGLTKGRFIARGDGISEELVLVHVDLAKTVPPDDIAKLAKAPAPTSQAARAVLDQLKGFEQRAKAEVHDLEEARAQIRALQDEVTAEKARPRGGMTDSEFQARLTAAERQVEARMKEVVSKAEDHVHGEWTKWADRVLDGHEDMKRAMGVLAAGFKHPERPGFRSTALGDPTPETPPRLAFERLVEKLPATPTSYLDTRPAAAAGDAHAGAPRPAGKKGTARDRVLGALARLHAIGTREPDKHIVAVFAGVEPGGSTIRGVLADLVKEGFVEYPSEGVVALTNEGRAVAPRVDSPANAAALRDVLEAERLLNATQLVWFDSISAQHPRAAHRAELATQHAVEPGGSTERGILARLSALELIEYPKVGQVRLRDWVAGLGRRA